MNYRKIIKRLAKYLRKDKNMKRIWKDNLSLHVQDVIWEHPSVNPDKESDVKQIGDFVADRFVDEFIMMGDL